MNDAVPDPALDASEVALWRTYLTWTRDVTARVEAALLSSSGLSAADFAVLVRLHAGGGAMQQAALQASTTWSASRLSHQLRRMERRDLIARAEVGVGRAVLVEVRPEGVRALAIAIRPHALAVREHFLDQLTAEQRAILMQIMSSGKG